MFKLILVLALVAVASCDVSHLFRKPSNNLLSPYEPAKPVARTAPAARYQAQSSQGPDAQAQVLRLDSDIQPDGNYQYAYDTSNGINAQEQASIQVVGPEEASKTAQGSFSWTSPEGQPIQISYIADENGYQPQGDLPTPPPVPLAIQRALDYIAAHPQPQEPQRRY